MGENGQSKILIKIFFLMAERQLKIFFKMEEENFDWK